MATTTSAFKQWLWIFLGLILGSGVLIEAHRIQESYEAYSRKVAFINKARQENKTQIEKLQKMDKHLASVQKKLDAMVAKLNDPDFREIPERNRQGRRKPPLAKQVEDLTASIGRAQKVRDDYARKLYRTSYGKVPAVETEIAGSLWRYWDILKTPQCNPDARDCQPMTSKPM